MFLPVTNVPQSPLREPSAAVLDSAWGSLGTGGVSRRIPGTELPLVWHKDVPHISHKDTPVSRSNVANFDSPKTSHRFLPLPPVSVTICLLLTSFLGSKQTEVEIMSVLGSNFQRADSLVLPHLII